MPLPKTGLSRGGAQAYHLSGDRTPPHVLDVMSVSLLSHEVLDKARAMGITVTEYLAAIMLTVAIEMQRMEQPHKYRPVRISLPVNVRKYFITPTLRNFSYYVDPEISAEEAATDISFEEVARKIQAFMTHALSPAYLFAGINTNIAPQKLPLVQFAPLTIKNLVIRGVFKATGDRLVTTTLTNLGPVSAPKELMAHVAHFDFMLGPSSPNPICNSALITTGDTMSLVFSSTLNNDLFQQNVIRVLKKESITIAVGRH